MSNINQLNDWCDEARKLLSIFQSEGPNEMGRHNMEVADLLRKMRREKSLVDKYKEFLKRYEVLAKRAKLITGQVEGKKLSEKKARPEIKKVSLGLRQLKEELRIELGSVDPTATPQVRQAVLEVARNKPVYDDKCLRIQNAIDSLSKLPGTKTEVQKLRELLIAGKGMEPDYEAAYKALKGLTKTAEAGTKAAEKFDSKAGGKEFQAKLTAARLSVDEYEKVAGIADAEGVALERDNILRALESLDVPGGKPSKRVVDKAILFLNGVIKRTGDKTKTLKDLEPTILKYQEKLTPMINELEAWSPVEVFSPLLNSYDSAMALAGSQQLSSANDAFALIDKPITDAHTLHKGFFDQWTVIDQAFTNTWEKVLSRVDDSTDPLLNDVAGPIRDLITRRLRAELIPRHEFQKAVEMVKNGKVLEDLQKLLDMVRLVEDKKPLGEPKFADEGRNHRAVALGLRNAIKTANAELDKALKELETDGGLRSGYDDKRQKIVELWNKEEGPVLDESKPLVDRQKLMDELKRTGGDLAGQLTALKNEVEHIRATPTELDKSQKEKVKSDDSKKFQTQQRLAEKALSFLEEYGVPETHPIMAADPAWKTLKSGFTTLVNEAKNGVFEFDRLEKLTFDMTNKRGFIDAELQQRRLKANETLSKLESTIDDMAKGNSDHKSFFSSLHDRVTDCTGLVGSSTVTMFEIGESNITELKLEIETLAKEMADKKTNYKAVEEEIDSLKSTLKESVVEDYQAVAQANLMTRLEKILPDMLKPLSPKDALKKLAEFKVEVTEAKRLAEEAKANHKLIADGVKEAEAELKDIETKAPALYKSLKKRLGKAEKAEKGKEKQALIEIETARMLIADAKSDPAKAEKMNKNVMVTELENEKEGVTFKAARDIFEKNGKREADNARKAFGLGGKLFVGDCNVDAHDQMTKAFDQAEDLGKSEDYSEAMSKLQEAERLARYFLANPVTPEAAARKALKRLNKSWGNAISGYLKGLSDLKVKIKKECELDTTVGVDAGTKAAKALDSLASLFDASIFNAPATILTKNPEPKTIGARRTLKEEALLNVRRYQRTLADNHLLKTVADNPFTAISLAKLSHTLVALNGAFLVS